MGVRDFLQNFGWVDETGRKGLEGKGNAYLRRSPIGRLEISLVLLGKRLLQRVYLVQSRLSRTESIMRITKWGELGILAAAFIARRAALSMAERHSNGQATALERTSSCGVPNLTASKFSSDFPTVCAQEIATALVIDIDYARQILQRLKNGGIVTTQRGPRGGYYLSASPSEITMGALLHACEGGCFEVSCHSQPLHENCCKPTTRCSLKTFWLGLESHIASFLNSHTLQDLLDLDPHWLPGHPDSGELVPLVRHGG